MKRASWISMAVLAAVAAAMMTAGQARGADAAAAPTQGEPQKAKTFEDFIAETKAPCEGFKWGADLRLREVWINNPITLNKDDPNHNWHFQRFRGRVWGTVTPLKEQKLDLNLRLTWEGRHWCKPDSNAFSATGSTWDRGEVLFDHMNVSWANIADSPISIKVGRQDIIFGTGWLVLDGTPLDGSRTIFFDAYRASVDLADCKSVVDLVYIENHADNDYGLYRKMEDLRVFTIEEDERGAILYVTNNSLEDTTIEGYFMYKEMQAVRANGRTGERYTVGGAVSGTRSENWKYRVEGGHQFGHEFGRNVRAFGLNSRLSYLTHNKTNTQYRVFYEYLSGDDPGSRSTNESWDVLWGRWPQWSELYIYTYAGETRIANVTNLHRLGGGVTCNPCKDVELSADYHLLFAAENTRAGAAGFSRDNNFRGQLLTGVMRYKISRCISTHLVTEFFFPGNYYDDTRNDPAQFLRGEIVFTW